MCLKIVRSSICQIPLSKYFAHPAFQSKIVIITFAALASLGVAMICSGVGIHLCAGTEWRSLGLCFYMIGGASFLTPPAFFAFAIFTSCRNKISSAATFNDEEVLREIFGDVEALKEFIPAEGFTLGDFPAGVFRGIFKERPFIYLGFNVFQGRQTIQGSHIALSQNDEGKWEAACDREPGLISLEREDDVQWLKEFILTKKAKKPGHDDISFSLPSFN